MDGLSSGKLIWGIRAGSGGLGGAVRVRLSLFGGRRERGDDNIDGDKGKAFVETKDGWDGNAEIRTEWSTARDKVRTWKFKNA